MMLGASMRIPRTVALLTLGAIALWLVVSHRFAFVQTRAIDYLLPGAVGVGFAAIRGLANRAAGTSDSVDRIRPTSVSTVVGMSIATGFLSAVAFSALNGILDTGPSRRFKAVITDRHCYKNSCRLDLAGAPYLPDGLTSLTVDKFPSLGRPDGDVGDSVELVVKPGAFGRAWIASRTVNQVVRSQIPCARLAIAASAGDTAQLARLLDQGLPIESAEPALGCETPLMAAARAGQVGAMELLLRRGADPNRPDPAGQTALMNAVGSRSINAVRLLLAHGADPTAVGHTGGVTRSVMGFALEVGDTDIAPRDPDNPHVS